MQLKLIALNGANAGEVILVDHKKFVIGRDGACHFRPFTSRASRRHCVIWLTQGMAILRDLNSTNGTFLNDQRVVKDQRLKDGDRIRIDQLEFRFSTGEQAALDTVPPDSSLTVDESSRPSHDENRQPPPADSSNINDTWTAEFNAELEKTAPKKSPTKDTPPDDKPRRRTWR